MLGLLTGLFLVPEYPHLSENPIPNGFENFVIVDVLSRK
jgi:hypothetical protein